MSPKPSIVAILGDSIDGCNPRDAARHLITSVQDEQIECAVNLLEPHCRGRKVFMVRGSHYHIGHEYYADLEVCRGLKGDFMEDVGHVELVGTKKVIQLRHGAGTKSVNLEQILSRENAKQDEAEGRHVFPWKVNDGHVDAIFMGHHHRAARLDVYRSKRILAICPCWKWRAPFISSNFYGEYIPTIGGMKLIADTDELNLLVKTFPVYPIEALRAA